MECLWMVIKLIIVWFGLICGLFLGGKNCIMCVVIWELLLVNVSLLIILVSVRLILIFVFFFVLIVVWLKWILRCGRLLVILLIFVFDVLISVICRCLFKEIWGWYEGSESIWFLDRICFFVFSWYYLCFLLVGSVVRLWISNCVGFMSFLMGIMFWGLLNLLIFLVFFRVLRFLSLFGLGSFCGLLSGRVGLLRNLFLGMNLLCLIILLMFFVKFVMLGVVDGILNFWLVFVFKLFLMIGFVILLVCDLCLLIVFVFFLLLFSLLLVGLLLVVLLLVGLVELLLVFSELWFFVVFFFLFVVFELLLSVRSVWCFFVIIKVIDVSNRIVKVMVS